MRPIFKNPALGIGFFLVPLTLWFVHDIGRISSGLLEYRFGIEVPLELIYPAVAAPFLLVTLYSAWERESDDGSGTGGESDR